MSTILERFGPHLHRLRTKKRWTLREMGERANIAHSNIYYMETGRKDPNLSELQQLAHAFKYSIARFVATIPRDGKKR